jgi:hypothetical protein
MPMSATLPLPGFAPMASSESSSSAADSPARTSARPARVPVLRVSDPASGETLRASLASFDPASLSWRTSGLFAVEDSPLFSQTLPRSGMTQSGTLFLLPPLVLITYETESGLSALLPTPLASDVDRPRRSPGSIARGGGPKLMDVLLPTPTARLGDTKTGRGMPSPETAKMRWAQGRRNLDDWAALLPTPTASDANGSGSRNTATSKAHAGLSLNDWARGDGGRGRLLPTPQAEDHRNCADYSDRSRGHSPQLRHLGRGRLNPRFVEWMMGYPPGFTDLSGLDEPS